MINFDTAEKLGNKFGIDAYSVVREYVQIVFLNELYSLKDTNKIVFKGGTMLRLMFGSNRFSEDLDFSTSMDEKRLEKILSETMIQIAKQIPSVELKRLVTKVGYSWKIFVGWDGSSQKLTVKLDFSPREVVWRIKQGVITTELPVSSTRLVTYMDLEEVLAEKVRAIQSREKGRDIYDLWYLLNRGVKFDWELVQKKMDYYGEKITQDLLKSLISGWDQKKLDQDVRRFLPLKDRPVLDKIKELILEKI